MAAVSVPDPFLLFRLSETQSRCMGSLIRRLFPGMTKLGLGQEQQRAAVDEAGDADTAAFGSFNIPNIERANAAAIEPSAASPRKSRRGIGSGSKRDFFSLGCVVIQNSNLLKM